MAGRYTDIVDIVAPGSAAEGERVDVTVKVKNIDTLFDHLVACLVIADGDRFIDAYASIPPLGTAPFAGSFTMPSKDVTIYAYSYYPVGPDWILDDQAQKDVALVEVFLGTITKKELDYEDRWQAVPLYNIQAGTRTRVRITGRNDMASNQRMGCWWQVRDPDGQVVDEYSRWGLVWIGPGNTQEFVGSSFDLNKAGTYTIAVQLFMNPADQVGVDDYYGNLCTVAVAEEFAGTISRKELKYDTTTSPIPVL